MGLVFGIGSGLFSLSILWIIGILLSLLLSRSGKQGGVFGICALLVILTLIMVFYPREESTTVTDPVEEQVDDMLIARVLYAVFISLFFIVALLLYMIDHLLMPNIALAAKVKKTYTF